MPNAAAHRATLPIFESNDLSVAMGHSVSASLSEHFRQHASCGEIQEDLAFALWRPSHGARRTTAVIDRVLVPNEDERLLQGNVAFTSDYVLRVLEAAGTEFGVALIHSHLGPGWQKMSRDDVVAERDRLASVVFGRTGFPLLGMTWGTDDSWSARFWLRRSPNVFVRRDASTVRVVGRQLRITYHPTLSPAPQPQDSQVATASVWGAKAQSDLARLHVGIVGLGSVGSIVAESLARVGISKFTLIDHDTIEERNLDRTLGAFPSDIDSVMSKVQIATRSIKAAHTSQQVTVTAKDGRIQSEDAYTHALDCDVLFSCVDRPAPRHVLNAISNAHLIPVVDGGIRAQVGENGSLTHITWRIHTVGPERACLLCLGQLSRSEVSMDLAGLLDDPSYIQGLHQTGNTIAPRENVFPFSLSVAAHEVLQMIGLVTGLQRIGGQGPQTYHGYPGIMEAKTISRCAPKCDIAQLTATAQRVIT